MKFRTPTENEFGYGIMGFFMIGIFGGATGVWGFAATGYVWAIPASMAAHAIAGGLVGFYSGRDLDKRLETINKRYRK